MGEELIFVAGEGGPPYGGTHILEREEWTLGPISYFHYYKLNENIDFVNLFRNTIETIVYFTCHRQALYLV